MMARFLLALSLSLSVASEESLNEEVLKQLVGLIESDDATQSFLISKNNKVVHEYYAEGYSSDDLATSWSLSKTFYAALFGVAIEKGLISYEDLQKPISSFIPELIEDSKSQLTLYNLLAMRSGLEITEYQNEEMFFSMNNLEFAMNVDPAMPQGWIYEYNNVNTMLLNPIIKNIFNDEPHNVLIKEIFNPLGIEKHGLWSDSAGNDMTYYGIDLMPKDFLKFANLFMNNGRLNGKQIINEEFLKESIKPLSQGTGEWFGLHWSVRKFNQEKTLVGLEVTDGQFMFFIPEDGISTVRFTKYFHNYKKGHQVEFGILEYLLWLPYSWVKYITTLVATETEPGEIPEDDPSINFPDTKSLGVSKLNCPFTSPDACPGVSKIQDLIFGLSDPSPN
tara:strand:+ start:747 stop:1922 length:1176 start_codon:yes stop_codon:yes gene_type:complete